MRTNTQIKKAAAATASSVNKVSYNMSQLGFHDVWFISKTLVPDMLELQLVFQCLYIPLYVMIFLELANEYSSGVSQILVHLGLLAFPVIYVLWIVPTLLFKYTLLHSILDPNTEVMATTLEQMLLHENLMAKFRNGLLKNMQLMGYKDTNRYSLKELFEIIDTDKSGKINMREMIEFMQSKGMYWGKATMVKMWRILDHSRTGEIMYEDFIEVVFPTMNWWKY